MRAKSDEQQNGFSHLAFEVSSSGKEVATQCERASWQVLGSASRFLLRLIGYYSCSPSGFQPG